MDTQNNNNNQVKLLRKASRDFIIGEHKEELKKKLDAAGLDVIVEPEITCQTLDGEKPIDHDTDPTVISVYYKSWNLMNL